MSIALGGLASGMDTELMIARLMALEQRPKTRLNLEQRQIETRQAALRDLSTKLRAVRDAAVDLRLPGIWAPTQSVSSSADATLTARMTGTAASGSYSVTVQQLARTEQRTYDAATWAGTAFDITTDTGATYAVGAHATVEGAADAINNDSTAPVYAAVITDSAGAKQLVLTSRTSGDAGGFAVAAGGPAELTGLARVGQDAQLAVDGQLNPDGTQVVHTSATGVFASAISGLEVTARATGTATLTVSAPAPDKDAIVEKVKAFVEKYNEAVNAVRAKTTEQRVLEPKNDLDRLKGLLRGDSGLTSILGQMRIALSESGVGEIGISTGAGSGESASSPDALAGLLTLDEAKLRSALDSDITNVRTLLGETGGAGLAQRLETALNPVVESGGTMSGRIEEADRQLTRVRDAKGDVDRRLAAVEARLRRQFAALETALQHSQSQGMWLSGQLAALGANNA